MGQAFRLLLHPSAWPAPARYAASGVIVLAAVGSGQALRDALPFYPFLLLYPAAMIAALLFGAVRGLATLVLSALGAKLLLVAPLHSLAATPQDATALTLFVVLGAATAVIIGAWQKALRELAHERAAISALHDTKDLLLGELSHRVKNDMQILSSMIRVQSKDVTDPAARAALVSAADRAFLLGRVHDRLTRHRRNTFVDTREFISELCVDLRAVLAASRPITFHVEAEKHALPVDRAVPIGLIINELVTNACKYAFPKDRSGTVTVRFLREGDRFCLEVADDGVGLDAGPAGGSRMGGQLVRLLAEQVEGVLEGSSSPDGTLWCVRFPCEGRKARRAPMQISRLRADLAGAMRQLHSMRPKPSVSARAEMSG